MAADLTQSFIGKHVEKIVVGVAAAILVVSLVLFAVTRGPQDAVRRDLEVAIGQIKKGMEAADLDKILGPEGKKQLGLDTPVETVEELQQKLASLPEVWPPKEHTTTKLASTGREEKLAPQDPPKKPGRILPVVDLETAVGRGVTSEPSVPSAVAKLAGKNISDIVWVSCVGRFDLTEQLDEYIKAKAKPEPEAPIILTRVELERRTLKADGAWTDWEAVAPTVPGSVAAKMPQRPENAQEKAAVYNWWLGVKGAQEAVRRAPFYPLVAMDEDAVVAADVAGAVGGVEQPRVPTPPPPPAEGAAAAPAAGPEPPPPGPPPGTGKPAWAIGIPPQEGPAVPGERAEEPHVFATVWAHDLSVRPGSVYQYRMRTAVFNPAYGHPRADEKIRWVLDFEGEWSEPSAKVAVKPLVEFYFVGSFGDKANLQLHRWIHGQWVVVPSVPSSVGVPVVYVKRDAKLRVPGGTGKEGEVTATVDLSPGVTLVDMVRNFPYYPEGNRTPTRASVLVYTDGQGQMGRRVDWEDRREATQARPAHEGMTPKVPPKEPGKTTRPVRPKG